ncbi:hypothetical protein ACFLQO_01030, partial [Candidatus Aenigmatarchaeota archaeon]
SVEKYVYMSRYLFPFLASEKERISLIEKDLKTQSMNQGSDSKEIKSLTDDVGKLGDRISDSEKIVSRVNEAVTAIRTRIMDEEEIAKRFEDQARVVDKVTNAGGRLARLEEKLKNQAKDHDMRFSELIGVIKDLELGESKRISEFNDFIDKFHRLREKTDQNLRMFSQNVKKMGDIKGEIKSEINKENLAKLKGFGLEFDGFKKRIGAVEELIIRFNDNMEKFRGDIGGISGRTRSAEITIKSLTDKLSSERDRRVSLESKLKSYERGRDILFSNINNLIKDIEVGEAKRIREYNNFITNFQQTKAKTEEAMKTMRSESNSLKKMNDDLSVREMKISDSLNTFTEEINSRMNVNEGMFDSEMDEFKNRLDGVSREMVSLKKMQQDFYDIIGIRKKTPDTGTSPIDMPKSNVISDAPKPMSFEKEIPEAPRPMISRSESIKPPPQTRKPSTKSLIKKLNPKSPYNE